MLPMGTVSLAREKAAARYYVSPVCNVEAIASSRRSFSRELAQNLRLAEKFGKILMVVQKVVQNLTKCIRSGASSFLQSRTTSYPLTELRSQPSFPVWRCDSKTQTRSRTVPKIAGTICAHSLSKIWPLETKTKVQSSHNRLGTRECHHCHRYIDLGELRSHVP